MNLWLRLLWLLACAFRRAPIVMPDGVSILQFRVWPTDIDVALHMNNGRYLTLMDLGRVDFMIASGLWRSVWRNRWTPIATAATIRFRRELPTWQRFRLETRLLCWDDTLVVMEQTFVIVGGSRDGQIAARALFKGGLYDRTQRSFVTMTVLMQTLGLNLQSPTPSPEVEAFLHADDQLKHSTRA
jgi:acyl-CoA thioesterase FadM